MRHFQGLTSITAPSIDLRGFVQPHSVTASAFIDDFTQFLPDVLTEHKNIILLGDFNIHLDTDDLNAMVFTGILDAMGFIPHIKTSIGKAGRSSVHSIRQSN